MNLREHVSAVALFAAIFCLPLFVLAADTYPVKPIRLVIPTAAGGGMDLVGRLLAKELGEQFGQQVVVDNRSGGGTMIGTGIVARSASDGYTIVLVNMAFAANPALHTRIPYDPVKSFAPVTLLASLPSVLVVYPSLPIKSVGQLIALAKAKPGVLNYGSAGVGTSLHLITELLKSAAEVNIVHVPYNGAGPAIIGLLAGEVALTFVAVPPVFPHITEGRLRAVGVTSAKRIALLPNVPTIAESGLPGFEATDWQAILAPAGTPENLISKLRGEIVVALNASEVRNRIAALGAHVTSSTPTALAQHIGKELATWARVIKAAGIRAD